MRIRALKPGFFKSEELAELPPLYRLSFAGLWCCADRDGRIEDRPKRLKAEILPYDEADFAEILDTLEASGFIERYEVKSQRLIRIPSWRKHQHPRPDEGKSTLPSHTDADPSLDSDDPVTDKRMGSGKWEVGSTPLPPKGGDAHGSTHWPRRRRREHIGGSKRWTPDDCQHAEKCGSMTICENRKAIDAARAERAAS